MIYEVRTYTLRTGAVPEFEERYAKRLPARLKHSKLGGFWHTDFGPLNQVVHVYPYDDLNQRAAVREALAKDPERNALPGGQDLIVAQETEIMIPASFCITRRPRLRQWQCLWDAQLPMRRAHRKCSGVGDVPARETVAAGRVRTSEIGGPANSFTWVWGPRQT